MMRSRTRRVIETSKSLLKLKLVKLKRRPLCLVSKTRWVGRVAQIRAVQYHLMIPVNKSRLLQLNVVIIYLVFGRKFIDKINNLIHITCRFSMKLVYRAPLRVPRIPNSQPTANRSILYRHLALSYATDGKV